MGLDCTAYSNMVIMPEGFETQHMHEDYPDEVDDEFMYENGYVQTYGGQFPLSEVGVEIDRWYGPTDRTQTYGWRAGSYGGYNAWRELIAELGGYTPQEAWRNPDEYKDKPFFELVNFSDCEGTLGPVAALNLLIDFKEHRDRYIKDHGDDLWLTPLYDQWIEALTIASNDGFVSFH